MKSRAFTLIEMSSVMLIVAALTAISMPVFRSAVTAAEIRSSVDRLRQLHSAVLLYQADYGGGWGYNSERAVGLPIGEYVYSQYMGFGHDFFVSPCGYKPEIEPNMNEISITFTPYFEWTAPYYAKYKQNAVIFSDLHCNDRPQEFYDFYSKKRGLAVLLGGKLVNQYKAGMPLELYWFSDPPE